MFDRKYTVYSNGRNKTITQHLAFCSNATHKVDTDSRAHWYKDQTEDQIKALAKETGFKIKHCSKCGS